jgi:hypothetical protein
MRVSRTFFAFLVALSCASPAAAQHLDAAARDLAAKILGAMGTPEASRVTVRNLSSLTPGQTAEARQALEAELRQRGLRGAGPGGPEVRVTLSENRSGYLWVAEIERGSERQVVMLGIPRPAAAAAGAPVARTTIDRELLWESDVPLLDLVPLGGSAFLALSTQSVAWVRDSDRQFWMLPALAWPRDPRGRLVVENNTFRAYLPGGVCAGSLRPAVSGECREAPEPWPLHRAGGTLARAHFAATRNYFDGRVAPGGGPLKTVPPFYSAAALPESAGASWILAGLDGQAQLYDARLEPAGIFGIAGSDLASVESACGSGWQVLVTKRSGELEADAVQAYEVAAGQPLAVSEPAELPGPVTALWPFPDGRSALAVVRHLKTQRYAAFRLSIGCSR